MRALIAEPSHVVSLLLSSLFQSHGIEAIVVGTAEEALEALGQNHIDLLCLAYELGGMSSIDFVVAARKRELIGTQPIALFASTYDQDVIDRARQVGFSECFSKHQKADLDKFVETFVASTGECIPARVLLVEDSATNHRVIKALLEKQGVRVEHAKNGMEAIERISTGGPLDLVLMDCQMPLMDGYEATRRIRHWEHEKGRPSLPIVALTANTGRSDRDRCVVAGMNDYLKKPISPKVLANTLARWLPGKVDAWKAASIAEKPLAHPEQDVFVAATMLARFGGDREIAEIAVRGALDSVPEELSGLCHSCDTGDAATARRHAHTIKSLTASVAALPCSTAAKYIEDQLADGALDTARNALPRLDECFMELSRMLQDWLRSENKM